MWINKSLALILPYIIILQKLSLSILRNSILPMTQPCLNSMTNNVKPMSVLEQVFSHICSSPLDECMTVLHLSDDEN